MKFKREQYVFEGMDKMPNDTWNKYFIDSTIGKSYEVLYEMDGDKIGKLVMSDTEYELKTNTPLYVEMENRGPGTKLLSFGYGIGFINETVRKNGAELTVIEKYPEVISLAGKAPQDIRLILEDVNTIKLEDYFQPGEFDIIFADITNSNEFVREQDYRPYLSDNGRFMYWTHKW